MAKQADNTALFSPWYLNLLSIKLFYKKSGWLLQQNKILDVDYIIRVAGRIQVAVRQFQRGGCFQPQHYAHTYHQVARINHPVRESQWCKIVIREVWPAVRIKRVSFVGHFKTVIEAISLTIGAEKYRR